MMGSGYGMTGRWSCNLVLTVVIPFLVIIISGILLTSRQDGYFNVDSTIISSDTNLLPISHKEKTTTPTIMVSTSSLPKVTHDKIRPIYLRISNIKLPTFNTSFRNPCWYERWPNGSKILRCLPFFYLAGFAKSGTTDLYSKFMNHPLIIGGIIKEPHYFDRRFYERSHSKCSKKFHCASLFFAARYFSNAAQMIAMTNDTKLLNSTFLKTAKSSQPSRSTERFIEAFPQESKAIWKEGQKIWKYPGITVDGSAATVWDNDNFKHIAENVGYDFPRNTTADWIRKIRPDTKIIMIVRDPVTRAFSDYMFKNRKPDVWKFHRLVQETIPQMEKCLESGKPALLCMTYKYKLRMHISLYYFYIKSWFEKFPREQILILRLEDYSANKPKALEKVFKFLELPAISQSGLEFISKSHTENVKGYKHVMLPQTKTLLTDFYKPFNKKLANLMGDDRFLWNENRIDER